MFKGHAVFGIASLEILAKSMQTIVEDCASAAKSKDARDKYFQTYVGDYGACSSKALRSELPSLEVRFMFFFLKLDGGHVEKKPSDSGRKLFGIECRDRAFRHISKTGCMPPWCIIPPQRDSCGRRHSRTDQKIHLERCCCSNGRIIPAPTRCRCSSWISIREHQFCFENCEASSDYSKRCFVLRFQS